MTILIKLGHSRWTAVVTSHYKVNVRKKLHSVYSCPSACEALLTLTNTCSCSYGQDQFFPGLELPHYMCLYQF